MLNIKKLLILTTLCTLPMISLTGCTFNTKVKGAEDVLLVEAYNVKGCQKLGTTTAHIQDKIAGVTIPESQAKKELVVIAKNDAVALKGDSIVPLSPIKGGFQSFGIYKCRP